MNTNLIFDSVIAKTGLPTLKRALDLASLRQKVTAGNIANAQTPGFAPRQMDFDGELKKLVTKDRLKGVLTNVGHLPIGENKPGRVLVTKKKAADGAPDLDVESEMAALAETQIWYQMGTTLAKKKFESLRLAIRGDR
jgi:flagellar basal-body rod protein FlgB